MKTSNWLFINLILHFRTPFETKRWLLYTAGNQEWSPSSYISAFFLLQQPIHFYFIDPITIKLELLIAISYLQNSIYS